MYSLPCSANVKINIPPSVVLPRRLQPTNENLHNLMALKRSTSFSLPVKSIWPNGCDNYVYGLPIKRQFSELAEQHRHEMTKAVNSKLPAFPAIPKAAPGDKSRFPFAESCCTQNLLPAPAPGSITSLMWRCCSRGPWGLSGGIWHAGDLPLPPGHACGTLPREGTALWLDWFIPWACRHPHSPRIYTVHTY